MKKLLEEIAIAETKDLPMILDAVLQQYWKRYPDRKLYVFSVTKEEEKEPEKVVEKIRKLLVSAE